MPAVECPECHTESELSGRPGKVAPCSACGADLRIPLPATSSREVTCAECGEAQTTGAAPGRKVACEVCGAKIRVPMREASTGREVTCPECGATRETPASPGKKTRCRECDASFRVPLDAGSEPLGAVAKKDAAKDAGPRTTSPCQVCGEEFPRSWGECPECGTSRTQLRDGFIQREQVRVIGLAVVVALVVLYLFITFGVYGGDPPLELRPRFLFFAIVAVVGTAEGIRGWLRA